MNLKLSFYEFVIVFRYDLLSVDLDRYVNEFVELINKNNGSIIKTEYWGSRFLEYEIKKQKKAHYVFVGFHLNSPSGLKEIEKKIKLNENIIRHLIVKVDEISKDPSPILLEKNKESTSTTETINITSNPNRKEEGVNKTL